MKRILFLCFLFAGCADWQSEQWWEARRQADSACNLKGLRLMDFKHDAHTNTYIYRCTPPYALKEDNGVEK